MAFRAFTMFCNHYLYLVPNMLSLLKESVPIMNLHSISPLSQLLATTRLLSECVDFLILNILFKWSHMISDLLWHLSLSIMFSRFIHFGMYQYLIHFYSWMIFHLWALNILLFCLEWFSALFIWLSSVQPSVVSPVITLPQGTPPKSQLRWGHMHFGAQLSFLHSSYLQLQLSTHLGSVWSMVILSART